ncbi:hypothetical protein D3C80_1181050 [compost metagenome]
MASTLAVSPNDLISPATPITTRLLNRASMPLKIAPCTPASRSAVLRPLTAWSMSSPRLARSAPSAAKATGQHSMPSAPVTLAVALR